MFRQLQHRIPDGEKKGLKLFGKQDILQNGEIPIYTRIMKCQMNGNYYAENKTLKTLKFSKIKLDKIQNKKKKTKK